MRWCGFACVVAAAGAALVAHVANARADWVNETTTSSRVRALRFGPDGLTVWAASSNSGIYSSLDEGTTWTRVGPSLPHSSFGAFAIKPGTPDTILAEAVGRVYRSTDGGETWKFIVRFTELAHTIEFHQAAPSDVYLGGGSGMWKSTNSGASWSRQSAAIGSRTVNCIATHPTATGLVIAGTNGGPYRTTNGGASWSLQDTGLQQLRHSVITAIWIDPASVTSHTNTVMLGSWQGIFRSSDGGQTWKGVGGGSGGPAAPVWDFADGSAGAHPYILAACSSGVYRSIDSGRTWTRTLASPATAVTASGSTAVVSCRDFELQKSIDGGLTWSQVTGVGQLDGRRLSADAASDGKVYGILTSDTGESVVMRRAGGVWTKLTLPQPYPTLPPGSPREVCASPTTPGTVFVAVDGGDSSILRSTDSGAVWKRSTLSSLRNFLVDGLALNPSDGEVGLLAATAELGHAPMSQAFLRSSDPGAWSEVTIPELDPVVGQAGGCAIRGGPSPTYYIGGPRFVSEGKVIKSTNGGKTWATCGAKVIPSSVLCIAVDGDSGTSIVVGTSEDGVWASTDDGTSWAAAGLTGKIVNGLHRDGATLYAAAVDGIWATTDWGRTWSRVGSALTGVRCYSVVRSGNSLFAGVDGRGIWRFDL